MIVTILRHGEAGNAATDRSRALTATGRADVQRCALRFREQLQERSLSAPGQIGFSTWLRTAETAQLMAGAFPEASLTPAQALIPGQSVATAARFIQTVEQDSVTEHLLLVSHQPLVSQLVGQLSGSPGLVPGLPPGGLVSLELEVAAEGCARLLFWSFPPVYEASQ